MSANNEIVCHLTRQIQDRQNRLARIMSKNGITLKAVSIDSGIPYNTLRSYFPGDQRELFPAIMPITALVKLFGVLPDEWLSLLTEPEGRCFSKTSDDEGAAAREVEVAKAALDRALGKLKSSAA